MRIQSGNFSNTKDKYKPKFKFSIPLLITGYILTLASKVENWNDWLELGCILILMIGMIWTGIEIVKKDIREV